MFANKYLQKQDRIPLITQNPNLDVGIIVVIPCFLEPDILETLKSLNNCKKPDAKIEVIILINHSEIASAEQKAFNQNTKRAVGNWIKTNSTKPINYFAVGPVELKKKWAGAGLARKKGMDEAIYRLNILEKPEGIIVSLDADTLVSENYFVEIEKHFKLNKKHVGATISFKHQTKDLTKKHFEGIKLYEKYLEYYKSALDFTGYPFSMFTIGSAFVVTADAYVKRGGMNRRQAGEDFYFLQNLVQIGKVGEIKTATVFPSARLSNRVPFGTGPILQKWMKGEEDLNKTFSFQAFSDLKKLFDSIHKFFKINEIEFEKLILILPESVRKFVIHDNFWEEINDLSKNCSTQKSFQSRFFQKFNAFKILKFLNYSHENFYEKEDLKEQIKRLSKV